MAGVPAQMRPAYKPGAHEVQLAAPPGRALYSPAAQLEQLPVPGPLYMPTWHAVQTSEVELATSVPYLPAAQAVQAVPALGALYVPALHVAGSADADAVELAVREARPPRPDGYEVAVAAADAVAVREREGWLDEVAEAVRVLLAEADAEKVANAAGSDDPTIKPPVHCTK